MATKRRLLHTPARNTSTSASHEQPAAAAAAPIADPATATALKLWLTFAKAYQAIAEVSRIDIGRHGLSPAEFSTLEALYHKGPLLLGDLQRKVLVSSGGTTFLVDRLAKRGLVERLNCQSDRRARYAALTREGVALMRKVFPLHAEAMREGLEALSQSEQKLVTTLIKRLGLAAAAQAAAEPGCREGIGGV